MTTLNTPTNINELLDYIELTNELIDNLIIKGNTRMLTLTRTRLASMIAKIDNYLFEATTVDTINPLVKAQCEEATRNFKVA